jgi:hypothetical protein
VADPILVGVHGVGIFLARLGSFIWLLARADEIKKRARWEEMKRERKKNE